MSMTPTFAKTFVLALKQQLASIGARFDASQTLHLERELTHQKQLIIEDFGPLKSQILIPFDGTTPVHAEFVSYPVLRDVGRAEVIANDASDIPLITVDLEDNKIPLLTVGGHWVMNWLESKQPDNINKIGEKRRAVADAIARAIDQICMIGFPHANLGGFLNNPLVPKHTLTTGTWLAATAAQILSDLSGWEESVIATSGEGGTRGDLYPNTLALPSAECGKLLFNAGTGTDTSIWGLWTTQQSKGVMQGRVSEWELHQTDFAENILGDRRGTMYRKDPRVLVCEIPQPFEERPPIDVGLASKNIAVGRTAGTVFLKPAMASYAKVG